MNIRGKKGLTSDNYGRETFISHLKCTDDVHYTLYNLYFYALVQIFLCLISE